jgi:phospholipid/cholesterol/gamma-HCH transport system permease protein
MTELGHSTRRMVEETPREPSWVSVLGGSIVGAVATFGASLNLGARVLGSILQGRVKLAFVVEQFHLIGVRSLPIIVFAALAIGMVLALQVAVELLKFQGQRFVANITCVSILREFGPVFTALLLAGRAGSAMTAEIGTMKITEQLSAMRMLGLDLYKFLIVPRVLGCFLGAVTLTVLFDLVGILGGTLVAVFSVGIPFQEYHAGTMNILNWKDLSIGLIKAGVFGLIIATLGCYWGLRTEEGAKGVGEFTKHSVVTSSVTIILSDFFLSKLLLNLFGLWG